MAAERRNWPNRPTHCLEEGTNSFPHFAAAYAEIGRFNDAKENAEKAIELARAEGRKDMEQRFDGELKRYEAGLPLHQ